MQIVIKSMYTLYYTLNHYLSVDPLPSFGLGMRANIYFSDVIQDILPLSILVFKINGIL